MPYYYIRQKSKTHTMYKSFLLPVIAILCWSSTMLEADIKNCWILIKAEDNGTAVQFKSDCVPFIDPNGTVGCYNYYDKEILVDGSWKKQGDNKMTITRQNVKAKYSIYSWSENEIIIGLESKPSEREYFTRK